MVKKKKSKGAASFNYTDFSYKISVILNGVLPPTLPDTTKIFNWLNQPLEWKLW